MLSHEVKTLSDKLSLMKEVNQSGQLNHEANVNQLKSELFTKTKEREHDLKEEFLNNLNVINDTVVGKHQDLVASYNLLVE